MISFYRSVFISSIYCFALVRAQWVLDNRCRRRRHLHQRNVTVALALSRNNAEFEAQNAMNNFNTSPNHNKVPTEKASHWYAGLRGRSTPGIHDKAISNSIRSLDEGDPTSFMMRLHWEEGSCWQGEMIPRSFCMQCENGDSCAEGNKLWTQFCDNSPGQKFVWVPNLSQQYTENDQSANFGQLKLAYFDLCLERMTTNTYLLQKCDMKSPYQVLVGWHPNRPFELHPVESKTKCINQHHHPRPKEEIANTACETAQQFHTNLWEVHRNENAANELLRLRTPQCSRDYPCGKCQGDCDDNEDCRGVLLCLQKNGDQTPVPGCEGIPVPKVDYCASPDDLFGPPIPNHGLRLRQPPCTPENPCGHCVGDCDSDQDCKGSMKCLFRGQETPDGKVPNCAGEGLPEADYCYEEDKGLTLQVPVELDSNLIECGRGGKICMQCQGDCDRDTDCYGPLRCFQRSQANPVEAVPGCQGIGKPEVDYCALPHGFSFPTSAPGSLPTARPSAPPTEVRDAGSARDQDTATQQEDKSTGLVAGSPTRLGGEIRSCSRSLCAICEGDCDVDADCVGSLVCLQRPWTDPYRPVPGCEGKGIAGADYCVMP